MGKTMAMINEPWQIKLSISIWDQIHQNQQNIRKKLPLPDGLTFRIYKRKMNM